MRKHEFGFGDDLIEPTRTSERHLRLITEPVVDEVSAPIKFGSHAVNHTFWQMLGEVKMYDQLTIGSAEHHATELRKAIEFGGGVLIVVEKVGFEPLPTQLEQLDI